MPAVFLRLAGCNLRCHFCDTEFESNWERLIPAIEVFEQVALVRPTATKLVVITGGEPLLQNLYPLVEKLCRIGLHVQLETAGTLDIPEDLGQLITGSPFPDGGKASVVVSPKTPAINKSVAAVAIGWKYIVRRGEMSFEDGLPVSNTQAKGTAKPLARPSAATLAYQPWRIFLQPCDEHDEHLSRSNIRCAVDTALTFGYRLCLQQHKIVGLD